MSFGAVLDLASLAIVLLALIGSGLVLLVSRRPAEALPILLEMLTAADCCTGRRTIVDSRSVGRVGLVRTAAGCQDFAPAAR